MESRAGNLQEFFLTGIAAKNNLLQKEACMLKTLNRKPSKIACLAVALLVGAALSLPVQAMAAEQSKPAEAKPDTAQTPLKVGDMAPDFTLKWFDGAQMKDVSLHDYHGKKNVVVAFFVFAFTGG